jgi:multidrug efflux pump subunit AcrA (membrane-fusion protein)
MSFGFSIGDFVAIGTLIAEITSSLREAGGALSEYQELVRELEALHKALRHVDALRANSASQDHLDSIKYAALSCRQPLEEFLSKIRTYERSLGVRRGNSSLRATADKLRWSFGKKDEVRKLQSYLSIHVGTINILLAEYGLEKIDIAADRAEMDNLRVRERLDNTRGIVEFIKDKVVGQTLAIQTAQSMLIELFQMVGGEIKSSITSLSEAVVKVW